MCVQQAVVKTVFFIWLKCYFLLNEVVSYIQIGIIFVFIIVTQN
jgi:hypothetical protein